MSEHELYEIETLIHHYGWTCISWHINGADSHTEQYRQVQIDRGRIMDRIKAIIAERDRAKEVEQ